MSYRTYRGAPRGPRSTSALTMKLVALSAAAAIAIGGLIAGRMAAGEDPALGPKAAQANVTKTSVTKTTSGGDGYGSYASPSVGGYSSQPSMPSPTPLVTQTS